MADPLPTVSREVHLIARPAGQAALSNFAVTTVDVQPPKSGEILVRNSWLSVDPYMRGRMNDAESYVAPFDRCSARGRSGRHGPCFQFR